LTNTGIYTNRSELRQFHQGSGLEIPFTIAR
jgi:hypothetical protein